MAPQGGHTTSAEARSGGAIRTPALNPAYGRVLVKPTPAPTPMFRLAAPLIAAPLPIERAPLAALLWPALAPTALVNEPAGVVVAMPAPIEVLVPVAREPAAAVPVLAAPVIVLTALALKPPPKLTLEAAKAGLPARLMAATRKNFRIIHLHYVALGLASPSP